MTDASADFQPPTDDLVDFDLQAPPVPTERMAIVRLGDDLLAIQGKHSKEIIQVASFTPLPKAPSYLLGIINLRGDILPLIDLHSVLGSSRGKHSEQELVLVVEHQGMRIALTIDEIQAFDPVALDEEHHPVAQERFGSFIPAMLRLSVGQVALLDVPQLVDTLRIKK